MPSSSEQRTEQEQELWRELQANVAAVAACYPSAEALREEAAEAERLAARDGVPPKTAAVVRSLMRRWSAFLEVHGDEYGFDVSIGPTVDLAVTFQTHGYHERLTFSTTEESGMGDSWGKLAVPYLLPRYVFPLMEHAGWTDLRTHELDALCLPYKRELRANWERLKVSQPRAGVGNGHVLKKDRWCDGLLYKAQDTCMADKVRVNRSVTRLAVFGFVKLTCSRSGAMGRDAFDRAGLQVRCDRM